MAQKVIQSHDSTADNKVDIFMPIYIGDYLKDTNRLSAAEHGAYLLLMFDYWQNGSLPDNDTILCRLSRMSADEWKASKDVITSFFKRVDGRLVHVRIDKELGRARDRKERFSKLSKAGVTARKTKPTVNHTDNHTDNRTVNHTDNGNSNPSPSPSPSPSTSSSESTSNIFIDPPEYEKIKFCKPLSKITPERYLQIKRSFPNVDADKAVTLACLKATEPDANITNADGWLIKAFQIIPEKKVYNVSPFIRLGEDE